MHVEILSRAFSALEGEELGRLRGHCRAGTPICCGPKRASLFADGRGGG